MYKEIQCALSRCTYQGQHEVEKGSATVEEDGQQRGDRGKQQAHIPAHNNPQGLQDLMGRTAPIRTNPHEGSSSSHPVCFECTVSLISHNGRGRKLILTLKVEKKHPETSMFNSKENG